MSKKLLIAVLSLMFCSFGIATADIGPKAFDDELPRMDRSTVVNPDAPGFNERIKLDEFVPDAGMGLLERPNKTPQEPTVFWPPDTYCDYENTCEGYVWTWLCPDEYVAFLTRFTVDVDGYTATLKTAYIGVDPAFFTGSPDLIVEVRDGDLITVRGSVTVPFASLPTTAGLVTVDLTSIAGLDYNDGDQFTIVVVDPGGGNTICLTSDNGGHGGNVIRLYCAGCWTWGDFASYGADGYNLDVGVELCYEDIPYTNCVRMNYLCEESNALGWYVWSNWSLTNSYVYPKTHYFQQFQVDMPCTVTAIGIADFGTAAWGYGSLSHGIDWMVCPDDGAGWPDTVNYFEKGTIAWDAVTHTDDTYYGAGISPLYSHADLTTEVLVDYTEPFYLVWNISATSHDPLVEDSMGVFYWITDESECGYATKVGFNLLNHPDFGIDPEVVLGWNTFMMYYGGNFNLAAYVDVCQDEFAVCKLFKQHCDAPSIWMPFPNTSGSRRGAFQKFTPIGLGCRIEKVRYAFGDASFTYWEDGVNMYGYDCYMIIRDVATDDLLTDSILIPTSSWQFNMGGDYTLPPAWYEIDLAAENVRFDAPVYVGATCPGAATYDDGVYILSDYGECYATTSYLWYPPDYVITTDLWPDYPFNWHIQIDVCCIPPPERDCEAFVGGDWPTAGHDFRRTAASWNTTGNAHCKQYLAWMHADVTDNFVYSRPTIYDGILLVAYNNKLQAFDIAASDAAGSSVTLWKIEGGVGDPGMPVMGTSFRNSMTVHNGYVYFGGGNAMSFNRCDVYTGSDTDMDGYGMDIDGFGVPVDPNAWTRNVSNGLAFAGNTNYTVTVILDVDGTDVLFVASEAGDLWALYAATGAEYTEDPMVVDDPGWTTNPVLLDGNMWASLSSNGIDMLYAGTHGDGTGGTLYAIEAATGTIAWSLYAPDDLYGHELDHYDDEDFADSNQFTEEYFQGPAAVDMLYGPGDIYIRSSFNYPNEVAGTPSGVRYKIDAGGNVVWYANGRSYWQSGNVSISGPVLDANNAYFTAIPAWQNGSAQTAAVVKESGATLWESDDFFNGRCYVEGALDCRMLEADLYYQPNSSAQLLAIETDEGDVVFEYNYLSATSTQTAGVAIDPTHVVFTSYDGDVFVLKEGTEDRARLRILVFDELASVPFFSPDPTLITFEDVFMNNGCINLTGSIEANEETSVSMIVNSVHPDRMDRMMETADQMIVNSYPVMSKTVALDMNGYTSFDNSPFAKDNYSNMAAYVKPDWLNEIVVTTYNLAPGETFSVEYNVNGPLVTRGPHYCYVTIFSDNDDYFINSPASSPIIQLGVLGGCMEADDGVIFGETSQNIVPFDNTGEFMCQEDPNWLTIDGDDARYWQGGMIVASSEHSIAFSLDNWSGTHDYWNSLLPEINCFEQCEPVVDGPVVLGNMWDGMAYAPIEGYYGAAAFIDSVVDFACDEQDWDWDNVECLYDNDLTMGLHFDEFAYGAIGAAEMNNFVIFRLDVTNRNMTATDEVFFGHLADWDLVANKSDVFMMDADHSIMWGFSCNDEDTTATGVWGFGKIPMGMGDTRVRTLDAGQAMWGDDLTLDSAYIYMSDPEYAGVTYQNTITWPGGPCNNDDDDREAYFTFASHTFEAEETFSFGYYVFGFIAADPHDVAKYQDLAVLVNALAGFNRGDIDADGAKTLADNTALFNMVYKGGQGPLFQHTADVAGLDGLVDAADVQRFADYWWGTATLDEGWVLPYPCPPVR